MGLDYSQKRLLGKTFQKGSTHGHDMISVMSRKGGWKRNLEVYAFLTGIMSTIISLAQVIIIAIKK